MSAPVIPNESVSDKIVNVVIIYDDLASASKANAMLEKAFHQAGEGALWNVKPWRLDLLNLPPLADEALKDAANAQLMVLALRSAQSPPAWLLDWLEQWAASREVGEAALAVFVSGTADAFRWPAMSRLPQFATQHGLNFIFDAGKPTEDEPTVIARGPREPSPVTATLPLNTDESPHQHWGINE